MRIGAFITITNPLERGDLYIECAYQAERCFDAVTIINGKDSWPKEFDWPLIGEHFQAGYALTDADWVFHLDTDFILHENDFEAIRKACEDHNDSPALSFYKYQFILPDRYNLKSRLVIAVNKAKFGNRIRFDSGGDLCQPSLDSKELKPDDVPQAGLPFYNYEKLIKTKKQIMDDTGRMARAWERHFGEFKLGGPSDKNAFDEWTKMTVGRFAKPQKQIPLSDHPKIMQDTIKNLRPDQWGYSGLELLERNNYAKI